MGASQPWSPDLLFLKCSLFSFCRHHCLLVQAIPLGASCPVSPLPSSPTSSPLASPVRAGSQLEPLWTPPLHLTDVILFYQPLTIPGAPPPFLLNCSFSPRSSQSGVPWTSSSSTTEEMLETHPPGPPPGPLRQNLPGWGPATLSLTNTPGYFGTSSHFRASSVHLSTRQGAWNFFLPSLIYSRFTGEGTET